MTAKPETDASDREIVLTRVFDAPRGSVFKAWTQPEHLVRWWAPDGCTTPSCTVDLRPGGRFHYCMRMPDGKDIWGMGIYREIVEPERIVYVDSFADAKGNPVSPTHYGMSPDHPAETLVTVTFVEQGARTKVTLRHSLPKAFQERKEMEQGWIQMLDHLAGHLAAKPAFELVLERVFDAPRERVFEAWTKPEHLARWFAPKPYALIVGKMDFRPGGRFSMVMRGPDGSDFPFTGTYREIDPPARLVWTGEFADGAADNIRTEVTFEALGRKTMVRARQAFRVMTPVVEHAVKGAKQGWTMTLDQLAAHVQGPGENP